MIKKLVQQSLLQALSFQQRTFASAVASKLPPLRLPRGYRKQRRTHRRQSFMAEGLSNKHTLPWWQRCARWRPTSSTEAAAAERGLLSLLNVNLSVRNVPVGPGKEDFLHTLSTTLPQSAASSSGAAGNSSSSSSGGNGNDSSGVNDGAGSGGASPSAGPGPNAPTAVILPGYGAGSGFYFKNFAGICNHFNAHFVDWLGTALSGRPRFNATNRQEAEDFFLNSLAKWREQVGLGDQKMILVGHSLGGYLAACYALKHPEHVQHLVLVCPAGVPRAPEDWADKFLGKASGTRAKVFKAAMWAWERGVTPHAVIRSLGPWGPGLCERYVVNRFSHHGDGLNQAEVRWFKDYFYHSVAASGSGEYALRHLLAPGAWAHAPLADRLHELKVPVTFIYGAHDWMRPEHAVQLCSQLKSLRAPRNATDLHVEIIEDAGHFVFMDQPELFNRALVDACAMHMGPSPANTPAAVAGDEAVGGHRAAAAHTPDATTWGWDGKGSEGGPAGAGANPPVGQ